MHSPHFDRHFAFPTVDLPVAQHPVCCVDDPTPNPVDDLIDGIPNGARRNEPTIGGRIPTCPRIEPEPIGSTTCCCRHYQSRHCVR
jgi:hypothetical protein